jgi:chaperone required for assembly of F1-ATPase
LNALDLAASNMKSTILAFALFDGKIDVEEAFNLSRLEENF